MTDSIIISQLFKRIIPTKEKSRLRNDTPSASQVLIRGNGRKAILQINAHTTCRTLMTILQAKRLVQGGRQLDGNSTLFDGAIVDALGWENECKGGMNVSTCIPAVLPSCRFHPVLICLNGVGFFPSLMRSFVFVRQGG